MEGGGEGGECVEGEALPVCGARRREAGGGAGRAGGCVVAKMGNAGGEGGWRGGERRVAFWDFGSVRLVGWRGGRGEAVGGSG